MGIICSCFKEYDKKQEEETTIIKEDTHSKLLNEKEENVYKNSNPINSRRGNDNLISDSALRYSRTKTKNNEISSLQSNHHLTKDIKINTTNIVNQKECSPAENYTIDKRLGEGSYGEVFKVKHKILNYTRAMKKIIRRSKNVDDEKEVQNEIFLLKQIDHPHIVKIFEFYTTKSAYFIITEICNGGELFEKILSEGSFSENHAAYIMYQVLSAVYNCHTKNILHRDLKPENILIDRVDNEGYLSVKIIDFGTAKIFEKDKAEQKVIGSAYYIAPEVLDKNYNEKCDLWSCGVILYILLTGKPPFGGSDDDEIISRIMKGVYNESELSKKSPESRDFIKRMLDKNPNTRISALEALKHPFFEIHETRKRLYSTTSEKFLSIVKKLSSFKYESKFQETALAFLVHNSLHLEEVRDLYKVFCLIDNDLDGKITRKELIDLYSILLKGKKNLTEVQSEVEEIFNNIDNDNNGTIEYEEFVRAVISKEKLLTDDTLKFAFSFFDKDNSGDISLSEIQTIFTDIDPEVLKKMISEIDDDSNGDISYEEFKKMMLMLVNNNIN